MKMVRVAWILWLEAVFTHCRPDAGLMPLQSTRFGLFVTFVITVCLSYVAGR